MIPREDICHARIETPLHPTEDGELVMSALMNIFPDGNFQREERRITGEASLSHLKLLLSRQKIRDTARSYLLSHSTPQLHFFLSKQAAAVGYANLVETHGPLGELDIKVEENADMVVDWLTGNPDAECMEEEI